MKTLLIAALALAPQDKKPVVACTLPILECLVREVGGEDVEVFSLCKADQDPHYVRATPLLQRKLRGADYFIEVGLQLEVWADLVANDTGRPRLQKGGAGRVVASAGIPREQIPTELTRAEGHVHAEGNPHLWLDPLRAVRMAKNIAAALPLKKEAVDKRLKDFESRVREALFGKELLELAGAEELERRASDGTLFAWLDKEELDGKKLSARLGGWLKKAEGLRGKKAVEYHRSWIYTAKILGFEIVGGIEEKPGIPPGPRHQIELTKKLKEGGIAFMMVDDFYDPALPKTLSADSGVPVVILPNQPSSGGYVEFFGAVVDKLAGGGETLMLDHESLHLMLQALAVCLVLTGIHGYLGIHVLERKVIFVDLAMAQIAALGATVALFLGWTPDKHPLAVYFFSLGFTLAGAAVFSLTRMRHEKVPQEAFIGIVYAVASALVILVLAKSTTAGEHLKSMLVGNILLARWRDIAPTAAIYAVIGTFHWFFREKFFRISKDHEGALKSGLNVRLWDFLFYATFGVVITSSVAIAGVLLVFCFLVVPSVIGVLFAEGRARRLAVAWAAGTLVSVVGIGWTFQQGDLPAGPVIVAAFAVALVLAGLARYVRSRDALLRAAAGAGVVALLVAGLWQLRNREAEVDVHHHESEFELHVQELRSADENVQLHAIDHFLAEPDAHAVEPLLELLKRTTSDRVLDHLAATLMKLGDGRAALPLLEAARRGDPALRITLAEASLALREPGGIGVLLDVAENAPRLQQAKALKIVEKVTGRSTKLREWWTEHGSHIKWREATGRFE